MRDVSLPVKNDTDSMTAGEVDLPTRMGVIVMEDPGQV